jgi:HYR domain
MKWMLAIAVSIISVAWCPGSLHAGGAGDPLSRAPAGLMVYDNPEFIGGRRTVRLDTSVTPAVRLPDGAIVFHYHEHERIIYANPGPTCIPDTREPITFPRNAWFFAKVEPGEDIYTSHAGVTLLGSGEETDTFHQLCDSPGPRSEFDYEWTMILDATSLDALEPGCYQTSWINYTETDPAQSKGSLSTFSVGGLDCVDLGSDLGQIVIKKHTDPAGASEVFSFTGAVSGSIGDGGTLSSTVDPGTYTVDEDAVAGWMTARIECDDADSSGDPNFRTATIHVDAGETVTCTFTNRQEDTTPPIVSVPDKISKSEENAANPPLTVAWTPTAVDDQDGPVPASCLPLPGSVFSVGLTSVTCTAFDAAGNKGSSSFTVEIHPFQPIGVKDLPPGICPRGLRKLKLCSVSNVQNIARVVTDADGIKAAARIWVGLGEEALKVCLWAEAAKQLAAAVLFSEETIGTEAWPDAYGASLTKGLGATPACDIRYTQPSNGFFPFSSPIPYVDPFKGDGVAEQAFRTALSWWLEASFRDPPFIFRAQIDYVERRVLPDLCHLVISLNTFQTIDLLYLASGTNQCTTTDGGFFTDVDP